MYSEQFLHADSLRKNKEEIMKEKLKIGTYPTFTLLAVTKTNQS